jgi:hypothetical protein
MSEFRTLDLIEPSNGHDIDDECVNDLLLDCHAFLAELLSTQQRKWIERDGQRLLKRLGSFVDWQTVH